MTYRDAIYISTDSHVTEPIEIYGERVDAAFRGRVPRIETVGEWRTLLIEGLGPRKLMPASEREVAIVGDFDAEDRFRDQLRDGVSAEVIFPTFALQACYAVRRRRVPTPAVPRVQQLGDRGVRRPPPAAGGHGVDARHRRCHRRRQDRRRAGLPVAVPARAGAVAHVQRRRLRPVLGRRPGPRPAAHVPLRHRARAARRARSRRRGRQLPDGRAARRPDGDPHPGRRRRARPVPRAHGSSRSRPARRGWRGS